MKPCKCGCGEMITDTDTYGRPHYFIKSHSNRGENNPNFGKRYPNRPSPMRGKTPWNNGIPRTEKEKTNISANRKGRNTESNNHKWKGDNVGYDSLHDWVKRRLLKPDICNNCNEKKTRIELSNISGRYKRDVNDWRWLCVLCHRNFDKKSQWRPRDRSTGRFVGT
jgi:hypothetical protein